MQIHIVNGPNLNLIGIRETAIYGTQTFDDYFAMLQKQFTEVSLTLFQSNIEGELIDNLQAHGFSTGGIILNAGGYTHTSVAIADTIAAITVPVIEVHISNIFAREEYRHISLPGRNCIGSISGFGMDSYRLAIQAFINQAHLKK
jgi:3-dehydroquinate dehydratase II